MRFWTVTISDSEGLRSRLLASKAQADAAAAEWVRKVWRSEAGEDNGPCPENWERAYLELGNIVSGIDYGAVEVEAHEIADDALMEAMADQQAFFPEAEPYAAAARCAAK